MEFLIGLTEQGQENLLACCQIKNKNAEIVELGHVVYGKNALPVPDSDQKNRQIGENELSPANPLLHRTIKPGILGIISKSIYLNLPNTGSRK